MDKHVEQEEMGSVYLAKCLITDKGYYGRTMEDNPEDRIDSHIKDMMAGSTTDFHVALRDHGIENFVVCWLHYKSLPKSKLESYEKFYILANNAIEDGYNMNPGGGGVTNHKDETKQKISDTLKERYDSGVHGWGEESRKKLSNTWKEKAARGEHPLQQPEIVKRSSEKKSKYWKEQSKLGNNPMFDPKVREQRMGDKNPMANHEVRKKASESMKNRWKDPAYRQRVADGRAKAKAKREREKHNSQIDLID